MLHYLFKAKTIDGTCIQRMVMTKARQVQVQELAMI